ncbi:MAG: hypothetical protein ABF310_04005 [Paracoccaceae bacterium]|jgi:Rod binding domain-containing protein
MEISHLQQNTFQQKDRLYRAAKSLEAEFIKTMLKESGFGEIKDAFSSSDQNRWLSFLHEAVAQQIVEKNSIGLSESLAKELGDK